jgi:hypothetical protein
LGERPHQAWAGLSFYILSLLWERARERER